MPSELLPCPCTVSPAPKFPAVGNLLSLPFSSGKVRLEGQVEGEAVVFWNEFRGSGVHGMGGWVKAANATKSSAKQPDPRKQSLTNCTLSLLCSVIPGTVPAEEGFAESAAFLHKLRLSAEPGGAK